MSEHANGAARWVERYGAALLPVGDGSIVVFDPGEDGGRSLQVTTNHQRNRAELVVRLSGDELRALAAMLAAIVDADDAGAHQPERRSRK